MPIYAYTGEDNEVYRLRLDEDTAAAGSFSSQTGFTTNVKAKVSKTNREHGIRPRGVRLSRVTEATVGRFLPVASNSAAESLLSAGTVTIGSETWTVTSAVAEDY